MTNSLDERIADSALPFTGDHGPRSEAKWGGPGARAIRIMAYNLYFGGADRVDDIHAVIAHAAPDAVALTEADDPGVVADLAARLGM